MGFLGSAATSSPFLSIVNRIPAAGLSRFGGGSRGVIGGDFFSVSSVAGCDFCFGFASVVNQINVKRMDASPIELVVHHGGKLIFSSRGPEYHGGTAIDITLEADNLSYESILKIGLDDLKYQSVERMFFLPPGHSLVDGLHPLHSEADVRQLVEDAKFGVVTLYLEATFCEAVVGDNEDDTSEGNPGYGSSGDEGDSDELNSGVGADVGVVHLIDDSDRTSDPEFMQAMANLGISHMRRRMRTTFASDGEEVDLVNELYVNQGHANDGGIAAGGNEVGTEGNGDNGDDEEVLPDDMNVDQHDGVHGDDERDFSSSDNHMVDDKVDGEEVSSMELQPFYDPHCDHLNMEWKVGMRFVSPQQFKEAVVMYNIKYGSQIRWKRSNRKCKEAVCDFPGCKWRAYASWFRKDEAFALKGVGKEHNCPRFTHNRGGCFIAGCRRFFALDGCFLKGEVPGMILSAVGKDGNNQMFPIAWAVVESENRSSWGWFITILQETMGLDDGTGWTVISDQQKPVNVDPTTTRRALQREGGPSWRAGVRRSKAVDGVGTSRADEVVQPTPPPASQPSE
ncbi:hypothetical protein LINGRAHAP2_LOCUS36562 [Linum grandiflorum]